MKLGGLPAISLNYRRLSSVTAPIGETQTRAGTPAISRQRERVPRALSCPLCLPSQLNYIRILRLAALTTLAIVAAFGLVGWVLSFPHPRHTAHCLSSGSPFG